MLCSHQPFKKLSCTLKHCGSLGVWKAGVLSDGILSIATPEYCVLDVRNQF